MQHGRRGPERVQVHCRLRAPASGIAATAGCAAGPAFASVDGAKGTLDLIKRSPMSESVIPGQPPPEPKVLGFRFDSVFVPGCLQRSVYEQAARPIVQDVLHGYNGTVLAYGQTGTGKTHTMLGPPDVVDALADAAEGSAAVVTGGGSVAVAATDGWASSMGSGSGRGGVASAQAGEAAAANPGSTSSGSVSGSGSALQSVADGELAYDERRGIAPRALDDIFACRSDASSEPPAVTVAYLQVYCELVHDLLGEGSDPTARALSVREDRSEGVWIEGATWHRVRSTAEGMALLLRGHKARAVAATRLNAHSSRSHAVFVIRTEQRVAKGGGGSSKRAGSAVSGSAGAQLLRGTLHLVDLAGSERAKRSGVVGLHLSELRAINLSLSALGNCIAALAKAAGKKQSGGGGGGGGGGRSHVPYRDSKLTRLLQDSLGGNAKTSLVITAAGDEESAGETLSTLQFGSRAQKIQVRARVNAVRDWRAAFEELQRRVDGGEDQAAEVRLEAARLREALEAAERRAEAAERRARAAEAQAAALEAALRAAGVEGPGLTGADGGTGDGDGGATGGGGSISAAVRDVAERFQAEMERQRAEAEEAAAAAQRRWEGRLGEAEDRAEEADRARGELETQLSDSRDEVLGVLREYRDTQKRLAEVEEGLEGRVAELVGEVEEERAARSLAEDRLEAAEGAMRAMVGRVREDFVSRERVAQMEGLYRDAIGQLQGRVDALEGEARDAASLIDGVEVRHEAAVAAAAAAGRPHAGGSGYRTGASGRAGAGAAGGAGQRAGHTWDASEGGAGRSASERRRQGDAYGGSPMLPRLGSGSARGDASSGPGRQGGGGGRGPSTIATAAAAAAGAMPLSPPSKGRTAGRGNSVARGTSASSGGRGPRGSSRGPGSARVVARTGVSDRSAGRRGGPSGAASVRAPGLLPVGSQSRPGAPLTPQEIAAAAAMGPPPSNRRRIARAAHRK